MLLKVRMGMCVNAVSEKIRDSMATVQCELELPKKKTSTSFQPLGLYVFVKTTTIVIEPDSSASLL